MTPITFKKSLWLAIFSLGLVPLSAQARVWLVGPDQVLKTPSRAIKLARDGDHIKITAGIYRDDFAVIAQHDLILEGVAGPAHFQGMAHLKATGAIGNGKAIWVVRGRNVTIRNIEFSGARVADRNGAGIRLEAGSLILNNCYFHHNEMGIVTANKAGMTLRILNSEFSRNTQAYPETGSLSHNIYVGAIDDFTMDNSISRGASYGHGVKSRARHTAITNSRIFDEGDMAASYLIDLPNGGAALIENNYLLKGRGSGNNAIISYGAEGMKYDKNTLTIAHNTVIGQRDNVILLRNHSDIGVDFRDNRKSRITADEIPGVVKDGF